MKNRRGLIIAAPASGSGKTTVTLALLRYLRDQHIAVASFKVGPDYIDPGFHSVAGDHPCYNLDTWAMRHSTLAQLISHCSSAAEFIITEGVMGLFDGASNGSGSTAEMSEVTGWPVILVVDAQGMAASAAALVHGFHSFSPQLRIAGVIFNRIGGPGHARLLQAACEPLGIPVLGCLPRNNDLNLPDRHLGLVQAQEHPQLEDFFSHASAWIAQHLDVDRLLQLAEFSTLSSEKLTTRIGLPVLGQRIAIAQDEAFAFCYPFVIDTWRAAGVEILPFSPLADQAPDRFADAVYLPGGYPELHAGKLAGNRKFLNGLRGAAGRKAVVYGECGGFMVLGETLVDNNGEHHPMAGLLPVTTSFAERGLHLGYRQLSLVADNPLGGRGARWRGHEFHFARLLNSQTQQPLFSAADAQGQELGAMGECNGSVIGSFAHIIDHEG